MAILWPPTCNTLPKAPRRFLFPLMLHPPCFQSQPSAGSRAAGAPLHLQTLSPLIPHLFDLGISNLQDKTPSSQNIKKMV